MNLVVDFLELVELVGEHALLDWEEVYVEIGDYYIEDLSGQQWFYYISNHQCDNRGH